MVFKMKLKKIAIFLLVFALISGFAFNTAPVAASETIKGCNGKD